MAHHPAAMAGKRMDDAMSKLSDFPYLDPVMEKDAANFLEPDPDVTAALKREYADAVRKELGNHTPEEIERYFLKRSEGGQPIFARRLSLAAIHMRKEQDAS